MTNSIALKCLRGGHKHVKLPDGTDYVFVPKHNIALCWIQECHVAQILSLKRSCCGYENRSKQFVHASEHDIRRWTSGGR